MQYDDPNATIATILSEAKQLVCYSCGDGGDGGDDGMHEMI